MKMNFMNLRIGQFGRYVFSLYFRFILRKIFLADYFFYVTSKRRGLVCKIQYQLKQILEKQIKKPVKALKYKAFCTY